METTICIFGDSITWGAWDKEKGGWVNRLRLFLEPLFDYKVILYNLGVSGDNTEDLLKRFKAEAEARKPNIIIFSIGANDSQYIDSKDNPRVNLEKFQENLNKLANQAKKITPKIIFIGLTKVDESKTMPIPWNKRKYYTNENVIQYKSIIESFCQENKILFVDILDLLNKEDLDDGLHPNSQGHQKMFERIKDFLLEHKIIKK